MAVDFQHVASLKAIFSHDDTADSEFPLTLSRSESVHEGFMCWFYWDLSEHPCMAV